MSPETWALLYAIVFAYTFGAAVGRMLLSC